MYLDIVFVRRINGFNHIFHSLLVLICIKINYSDFNLWFEYIKAEYTFKLYSSEILNKLSLSRMYCHSFLVSRVIFLKLQRTLKGIDPSLSAESLRNYSPGHQFSY